MFSSHMDAPLSPPLSPPMPPPHHLPPIIELSDRSLSPSPAITSRIESATSVSSNGQSSDPPTERNETVSRCRRSTIHTQPLHPFINIDIHSYNNNNHIAANGDKSVIAASVDKNVSPDEVSSPSRITSPVTTSASLLFDACKQAMLANILPGLILQSLAVTIVVCYFTVDALRPTFDALGEIKAQYGYGYSALAQCVAAGLIPSIFLFFKEQYMNRLSRADGLLVPRRRPQFAFEFVWMCAFWAACGVEGDAFYRLQSLIFGTATEARVIIPKVLVDELIYEPFFATPLCCFAYMLKDCNFNPPLLIAQLDRHFWTFQLPATIISGWCVWIPAVTLIYCLPPSLQIPLFNVVSCFWAILMLTLASNKAPTTNEPASLVTAPNAATVASNNDSNINSHNNAIQPIVAIHPVVPIKNPVLTDPRFSALMMRSPIIQRRAPIALTASTAGSALTNSASNVSTSDRPRPILTTAELLRLSSNTFIPFRRRSIARSASPSSRHTPMPPPFHPPHHRTIDMPNRTLALSLRTPTMSRHSLGTRQSMSMLQV